ncbi:alpha/beta-Hydrolases superfamily protein [Wolffia australiana]
MAGQRRLAALGHRCLFSFSIALRPVLGFRIGESAALGFPGGGGKGDFSRAVATLAYEEISVVEGNSPVGTAFILHGLLGSARNWRSFARKLASSLADASPSGWRMVLVDLRNHGRSAGASGLDPPHDMVNTAMDLANLVKSQKWTWPDVVIGHSMGGKVALEFAKSCAGGDYGVSVALPKQLWVLDSVPGEVVTENIDGEVEGVLKILRSLPPWLPSRKWVVDHMVHHGFSKSLSEWIASNLKKEGEHLTWAFDLPAAIDMFNSYKEKCYWDLLEHPPAGLRVEIVCAENSDRWTPQVAARLDSLANRWQSDGIVKGKTRVHVLPKSGHWVHVDNPNGLLDIMIHNRHTMQVDNGEDEVRCDE